MKLILEELEESSTDSPSLATSYLDELSRLCSAATTISAELSGRARACACAKRKRKKNSRFDGRRRIIKVESF
jgi:hypothetical protein